MVDWGVAWQHNCGSKVHCADNGRRYLAPRYAIANADQPPLPRLYTALLVWRFVVVKWRYIKYVAFTYSECRTHAYRQSSELCTSAWMFSHFAFSVYCIVGVELQLNPRHIAQIIPRKAVIIPPIQTLLRENLGYSIIGFLFLIDLRIVHSPIIPKTAFLCLGYIQ